MHINQIHLETSVGSNAEQASRHFFLNRLLDKNENIFDRLDPKQHLNEKIKELVENEKEQIQMELEDFDEFVSDIAKDLLLPARDVTFRARRSFGLSNGLVGWKYTGDATQDTVLMILAQDPRSQHQRGRSTPGNQIKLYVISKSKDDSEHYVGFFGSELNEIQSMVGDFVNLDSMETGGELVHKYFNQKINEKGFTGWQAGEFKNEFEKKVYQTVCEFTSIAVPNVNVELEVGENPEYDTVALPAEEHGERYAIEAKDFDQVQQAVDSNSDSDTFSPGNLHYKLITQPKEEAERSDLKLITIVRGIPDEKYDDLTRHARPSNVVLLNEYNYEEELEKEIFRKPMGSLKQQLE